MKIASQDLFRQLKSIWPSMQVILADREYWLPAESKVHDLVWGSYIEQYRYTVELFDCDDYALTLHAFVVQERYKQMEERKLPKEEWFPWAFGEVRGRRFNGVEANHAINICVTSDKGVLLIEPQNDKSWTADRDRDHAYMCLL